MGQLGCPRYPTSGMKAEGSRAKKMKSFILALALTAACAGAMAENYIRIPIPGILGAAGTTHPGLPTHPGEGNTAGLVLSTTSLMFGDVMVGSSSDALSVTVKNTGPSDISLEPIASGAFAATAGSTCGSILAAGAQCEIGVAFQPVSAGKGQSGALTIGSSVGIKTVELTGAGKLANYSKISVAPLTFASRDEVLIGQGLAEYLYVTIEGDIPVTFGNASVSSSNPGEFWTPALPGLKGCRGAVAAGSTCTIRVLFSPTTGGTAKRTATIAFPNNSTDEYGQMGAQATTATYNGSVVAQAGLLTTLGSVTNPWNSSLPIGFTGGEYALGFTNVGNMDVHIANVTVTGANVLKKDNCETLAPAARCDVALDISQLPVGVHDFTIRVDNDGLYGTTYGYARLTITP